MTAIIQKEEKTKKQKPSLEPKVKREGKEEKKERKKRMISVSLPEAPAGETGQEHRCKLCGEAWRQRKKGQKAPRRCPRCQRPNWWISA